jgi:hypothetical protein
MPAPLGTTIDMESMEGAADKPRRRKPWTPPLPECTYLRLDDFPRLYQISMTTAFRLAQRGVLPFIRIPGTHIMRFPRERTERIIKSWEQGGRRRKSEAG